MALVTTPSANDSTRRGSGGGWNRGTRTLVARLCVHCGGVFSRPPGLARLRKYCSITCCALDNAGSNAYNWKGGTTPPRTKQLRTREAIAWRADVLARDGGSCRQCGANGVENRSDIQAHHIIPVTPYPSGAYLVDNGISLCESHHRATNGRENETAQFFAQLIGVDLIGVPVSGRADQPPLEITDDELRAEYVDRGRSTMMIARERGVTPRCIQKYLKRFGIPARTSRQAARMRVSRDPS